MNDHPGPGKLIHDSFYPQSRFFTTQKRTKTLSFAWVILVLSLIIYPSISYASEGDELVLAAGLGHVSKVRELIEKGVNVNHQEATTGFTPLIAASIIGMEVIVLRVQR